MKKMKTIVLTLFLTFMMGMTVSAKTGDARSITVVKGSDGALWSAGGWTDLSEYEGGKTITHDETLEDVESFYEEAGIKDGYTVYWLEPDAKIKAHYDQQADRWSWQNPVTGEWTLCTPEEESWLYRDEDESLWTTWFDPYEAVRSYPLTLTFGNINVTPDSEIKAFKYRIDYDGGIKVHGVPIDKVTAGNGTVEVVYEGSRAERGITILAVKDSTAAPVNPSDQENNDSSAANIDALNISVSALKYNTLQLAWEPAVNAGFYEVYYSDSPTGDFRLLKKTSKPSVKFSRADCGQTYYFKVTAYQKSGNVLTACAFGEASGKTQMTGELKLTAKAKYNSVTLKWKKIKGAKEYVVRRSDGVVVSGLKSAGYKDQSVETGKTYTYVVTAVSYGEEEIIAKATASTDLDKAPKLKVKASDTDTLSLSWSKVPGAVFYDIYNIDMATGEASLIETVHAPQTRYSVTGLNPAAPYQYTVVARAGECEKASRQVVQTTKAVR